MSLGSVSAFCKTLWRDGLLKKSAKGNALFYSLNNESVFVKRLKSAWFLDKLMRFRREWENEEFVSVALYSSFASGEFVEKSDVDFLAIANMSPKTVSENFRKVKEGLKKEVSVTVMPLSEWIALSKKRDRFNLEVLSNHVLLGGSSIVVG